MKKHIFLVFGLFLLSSQSLSAASAGARPSDAGDPTGSGAWSSSGPRASVADDPFLVDDRKSTFLDGFKPDATAESLFHITSTFYRSFIGIDPKDPETEVYVIGIGLATRGLAIGGANNDAMWRARRDERIAELERQYAIEVPGVAQPILYPRHSVSPLDMKIAEALYCLVYERDRDWQNYLQVERGVREALSPILNHGNPCKLDAKTEAALGVWSFLEAMKIIAVQEPLMDLYPINPSTGEPCLDKEFLARLFNERVDAYQSASA
jgi:hypothetical protein